MPLVLGGAVIVALVVWIIRRRRGGNAIEPAGRKSLTHGPGQTG
jgi:hypothetical protein